MIVDTTSQDILVREGLDKNLLHFRPLNTRLMNMTGHASIAVHQFLTNRQWNSRVVNVLSGGIYVTGGIIAIPCATIESIASMILCGLGIVVNKLTCNEYAFIRKFNAKCFAYSLESVIEIAGIITQSVTRNFPKFFTEVTLADHGFHLISATVAHFLRLGIETSQRPEREHEQFFKDRAPSFIPLVFEGIQGALNEAIRSLSRDLGTVRPSQNLRGHAGLSQPNQDILVREIGNLNPLQLSNADYRNTVMQNLQPVVQEIQTLLGAYQIGNMTVFGPQGAEAKYQEHLITCTKEAINRVYRNDKLVECFSGGRDAIEGYYADTTIPLACMAQLIEIERFSDADGIKCPEKFNDRLKQYNTRHSQIKDLSGKLNILTPHEKDQLALKILKGSDHVPAEIEHEAEFNALITGIGRLGGSIHQGNLMSVLKLEMSANPVQTQNMFVKAWQEAVAALTSSAATN
jgi:hypothetical protein